MKSGTEVTLDLNDAFLTGALSETKQKAEFRRSWIEFGNLPTGVDASPLKGEYTYKNKEAMMSIQRGGKTRYFFFIGAGEVLIPAGRVPRWSHWLGFVNPAQYAADALRGLLLEQQSTALARDALVLAVLTVAIACVTTVVPWRER